MNATIQLALVHSESKDDDTKRKLRDVLDGLTSNEIVLGFSGPIGAGLKEVVALVADELGELGYSVVPIKLAQASGPLLRSCSHHWSTTHPG